MLPSVVRINVTAGARRRSGTEDWSMLIGLANSKGAGGVVERPHGKVSSSYGQRYSPVLPVFPSSLINVIERSADSASFLCPAPTMSLPSVSEEAMFAEGPDEGFNVLGVPLGLTSSRRSWLQYSTRCPSFGSASLSWA